MSTFVMELTKVQESIFLFGQKQGWIAARSGNFVICPFEEFSFEAELFADGAKLGHKAFLDSKKITS
jgi:hypothetical protein